MYNGIGLQTPRGSGTNGYIQSNKFFVRPKSNKVLVDGGPAKGFEPGQGTGGLMRKPNREILEHDRKRQIQLKLVVLEDKLVDQGYTDAEVSDRLDEARRTLEAAAATEEALGVTTILAGDARVSDTQTHQVAARKEKQMEALKAALGIDSELGNQKKGIDAPDAVSEESDDDKPRNSRKTGGIDDSKRPDKDTRDEEDDMVMSVKIKNKESVRPELDDLKCPKSKESKRRGHEDSSDTDDSEKRVTETGKKQQNNRRKSEHEDDSHADGKKKKQSLLSKHNKSKRHTSDDTDSDYDEQYEKAHKRRYPDDGNSDSDEVGNLNPLNVKQLLKTRRRHDSDADCRKDNKRGQVGRNRSQQSRYYSPEKVDAVSNEQLEAKSSSRKVAKVVEQSKDVTKDTKMESEMNSRAYRSRDDQKRHDYSKTKRSGGGHGENVEHEGVPIQTDLHYENRRKDRDYEEHGGGRRQSRNEDDGRGKHVRDVEEEVDWKHDKDGEYKRKEENRQRRKYTRDEEEVYRTHDKDGQEVELPDETKRKGRDYEEHGGGRTQSRDEEDRRGRKHTRDEENEVYRKHDKVRGHHERDEGDRKRRKTTRDEKEEAYKKHDKDGEHKRDDVDRGISRRHEKGGECKHGRHRREQEDQHETRQHERDRRDSSKRARYEDSRSSGKMYDNDKHEDGRASH
ncbi:hypothetical protein RJ639_013460 [Escallonia herrerae]|uniref:CWF21 domain-containing protein n=1 Tax=Escallonia herrerae TaxID=1293975 RepID=A0AA88VFD2_9ASTE|nr:hypothetical protein RJ639_013460 [Escallonia herrerae]